MNFEVSIIKINSYYVLAVALKWICDEHTGYVPIYKTAFINYIPEINWKFNKAFEASEEIKIMRNWLQQFSSSRNRTEFIKNGNK